MLLVLVHAFWRAVGPPLALADLPIVAAPALAHRPRLGGRPRRLAPRDGAAGRRSSPPPLAAWLCLRRAPADPLPLPLPEASS